MGKMGVFTRKGGSAAPDTGDDNNDNGGDRGNDSNVESDGAMVTCPECGCKFDPDDVKNQQSTPDSIDDKGAKQPIPSPESDPQAPIGENAITAALAAMGIH